MANNSASLLDSMVDGYRDFLSRADPRVENFFLMESPLPIAIICAMYVYFVLSLGPRMMADKKPLNLKNVLLVYNAAQSALSAVLFYSGMKQWMVYYGWGLSCYTLDFNLKTPEEMWTVRLCHIYFVTKITELADTIFFVLRKKNKHISLLHVFHHAAMPFFVWFGVKFHPGGNLAFFGLPNLFVHIWMYLYYLLAALGPRYQKPTLKRCVTQLQLGQFFLVMIYMLYTSVSCKLNKYFVWLIFSLDTAFIFLFLDFYRKTYLQGCEEKKDDSRNVGSLASGTANGSANGISCQRGNSSGKKNL